MPSQPPQFDTLATVDLGSNSFRLQISRLDDDQFYPLDTLKETVRLGAGLDAQKHLDEAAQQRAFDCLARFGERLRGFLPAQVRAVGTNTFRVARGAEAFIAHCEALLGFPIEVVAGREEARLIYLGAAMTLPPSREQRLVIDIGGGSTEFIIGRKFEPQLTESLPLGCVTFSGRYFDKGKLTAENFNAATLAARGEIQRITQFFRHLGWDVAVGTSGTARSINEVLRVNRNGDGITRDGLFWLKEQMLAAGSSKRLALPGLKADRVPVIAGGLSVMISVFEELSLERMIVTDGALRDGVLFDMLGRQREHDVRDVTVRRYERRYQVDTAQAMRVSKLAERLYRLVAGEDADPELVKCVLWAGKLHEIGIRISHTAYHKHTAYILQNADMPGFSRREQLMLSTLALGHRGDLGKMVPLVTGPTLWPAVVALRLAVLFCRCRASGTLPARYDLRATAKGFTLSLEPGWLEKNPLSAFALQQDEAQWKKTGLTLTVKSF